MLPHPSEIQYFLEVANTLNISRAAERLGITQPTLSLAVQRLEQAIGTPLLLRGKTGVRLTKAGTRFALQGKALVDQWERMRAETLSEESEVKGRVSIGCHPAVAMYSVPHFVPELMAAHPELEMVFHHDLSRKICERVISFEIDIGIVVNPIEHPDLRIVQLCTDEVSAWRGTGSYVKDVLICDPNIMQTEAVLSKMKKLGDEWKFRRIIHSPNLDVVAKLTSIGAGIGILPSRVALREPSYKLKPVAEKGPVFYDKVCLVYRTDAQRGLAAKTILRAIEDGFRNPKK